MAESPKINNSGSLGPIKDTKPKAQQAELELKPQQDSQAKDRTIKQNQIYAKPAESIRAQADQPALAGHDIPELISSERKPPVKQETKLEPKTSSNKDIKIDQQVLARNPVLAAQLQNRKPNTDTASSKPKKPAPNANPKTGRSKDIPARFLRTQLPGRLKGISDERIDTLEKLKTALEARLPDEDPRLINAYAKTLLNSDKQEPSTSVSMAELFAFDANIASLNSAQLTEFLQSIIDSHDLDPLQEQHIAEILTMLKSGDSELLKALVRLFLPLPFPYEMEELDDEFFADERELLDDSPDDDEGDSEDEEADKPKLPALSIPQAENSQLSISVRSFNYGKMHMLLDYNATRDSIKLRIKSDRNFDELGLALELALEDLSSSGGACDYVAYHWRDSVLRLAESRSLQFAQRGQASPLLLQVTNTLLETIYLSDSDDGVLNAKFEVL